MKRPMYTTMLAVAGIALGLCATRATSADRSAGARDVSALHTLWSNYQQAVARKDAKALLDMYVSGDTPVLGGIAPNSYALISAANKDAVPRTLPTTAKESVVGEVKLPPDQTENLHIQSDGEIGSISFDYKAIVGHGRIIWTTIRTNDGWKIASVTYSINVPAADHVKTPG